MNYTFDVSIYLFTTTLIRQVQVNIQLSCTHELVMIIKLDHLKIILHLFVMRTPLTAAVVKFPSTDCNAVGNFY